MSSATNIVPPATHGEENEGAATTRPNPVALETLVNITGARPSGSAGSRDLFSEETATVLVFKDGAVIRLAAPVSVGQLLFLTNNKSKEEIVCQVLHKRNFQATSCYVELQFTEDRPDFWGVSFPAGNCSGGEFRVPEHLHPQAATVEVPGTFEVPHDAGGADHLKKEVEALREQLFSLEKKKSAESAKAAVPAEGNALKASPQLAPVNDVHREIANGMAEVLAPLMPEATDKRESERAVVGMALPNPKIESAQPEGKASDAGEELLPEPIVPSSRMAAWVEPLRGRGTKETNRPKSAEPGKSRSVGLGMLLILAMAGGAWYGNWWQYLPVGRKPLEAGAVKVGTPSSPRSTQTPNAKAAVPTATVNQSSGPKELNAATSAAAAEAKSRAREALGTGNEGNRDVERTRETSSREVLANRAGENPSGTKERVVGKTALKQANAGNKGSEPSAKEIVASDAPVIPARLLKAVNPVYPPDAMRKYITGDVKAEVLVEPSGRVRDVTVIAGPQALRAAAVEALKQYEFAPATQGGKAVASKTTEVVKFWFNP